MFQPHTTHVYLHYISVDDWSSLLKIFAFLFSFPINSCKICAHFDIDGEAHSNHLHILQPHPLTKLQKMHQEHNK